MDGGMLQQLLAMFAQQQAGGGAMPALSDGPMVPPEMPPGMTPPAGPQQPGVLGGMLDSFMAMRERNGARPLGPTMRATMFQPESMVPGAAMDQQEGAAFMAPRMAEAMAPPQRPIPGAEADMDQAAAFGSLAPRGGGQDETAGATQPSGEAVPLPRRRPQEAGATDFSGVTRGAPAGAPMDLAPPAPGPMAPQMAPPGMPAAPAGPGFGDGFMDRLRENGPLLLALAGGFAGAPSLGTGMRRAFSNAAPVAAQRQALDSSKKTTAESRDAIYREYLAAGVPPAQARLAAIDPVARREIADKYMGAGKAPKAPEIKKLTTAEGERDHQFNTDTGRWEPLPGTVADPGDKRRSLSVTDIQKLSDEAGKVRQIERYVSGFKPEYAGDVSDVVGGLKNEWGKKSPVASKTAQDRSDWWADYAAYRNAVRKGLYGATLTTGETKSFLEQDITPGMRPDMVQRNLERQQKIVNDALKRTGGALIEGGQKKEAIAKAYGVEPSFFDKDGDGVADTRKPAAAPARGGKVRYGDVEVPWSVQ